MSDDPAAARFFAIQLVRVGGVIATVYALLSLGDAAPWPAALPQELGYLLLVLGLLAAFLLPQVLARRWRTPEP